MTESIEANTALLQRMPIFGGIRTEVVKLLIGRARSVALSAGEYFIREGSEGTSAFVLERGNVSILKFWQNEDYLLHHLDAGSCFGEVSLLDFGSRSASVRANVDCRAIELTSADLLEVSKTDLKQFALIYMNLGRELSRRLRAADERLFEAIVAGDSIADDYSMSPH
jgi:CRP/FNR family cyclic AMP-dependent transcriptional regulator